jgi:hypothetical protein
MYRPSSEGIDRHPLPRLGEEAVLEVGDHLAVLELADGMQCGLDVFGMDEIDEGDRHQLRLAVAEDPFERVVDALEVPVGAGHAQQVEGEVEEAGDAELVRIPHLALHHCWHRVHCRSPEAATDSPVAADPAATVRLYKSADERRSLTSL